MKRRRLIFERWPAVLYAIGDVHGCLSQLLALERQIAAAATAISGAKWIVMLGDYVDRGPQAAEVIEHLLQPPPLGFQRYCLVGNHEQMMLDFLADRSRHTYWLDEGGDATLASYGSDPHGAGDALIPAAHHRFLQELPISLQLPGWLFVHAGIRPGVPLAEQSDEDLIWIREPFLYAALPAGLRVVHGHTPGTAPVTTPHRIGIDTHCFMSGTLTAVRLTEAGAPTFLATEG